MCGLAGILMNTGGHVDVSLLERMSRLMAHRGPDDVGYCGWREGATPWTTRFPCELVGSSVALSHRRLAILDTSANGWQPMMSHDGRLLLVFNGEIYNFEALRAELERLGHTFQSCSDTEVLLAGYRQWGHDVLCRLRGMFAFVILDIHKRTLFLTRDFFGIKPLYYARWAKGFAFASEIAPLLELPGIAREVHPLALYDYLRFGRSDGGQHTMFRDVKQIPAASYVEVGLSQESPSAPHQYWRIKTETQCDMSFDSASDRIRDLFCDSVALHLRSDVSVGAALSGGIDSSAIVSVAREKLGRNSQLCTFGYVTDDPRLSEAQWMVLAAEHAKAELRQIRSSPEKLLDTLNHLITLQGEPFASTSIFAQHEVYRTARRAGIKVILDGQGADELFAGYPTFIAARAASLLGHGNVSAALRLINSASQKLGVSRRSLLYRMGGLLLPSAFQGFARRLVGEALVPAWFNRRWFESRDVSFDSIVPARNAQMLRGQLHDTLTRTSLPALLRYCDRNSMGFSIESRVPFLTVPLVEFAFSLPEHYIIDGGGVTKSIFRHAMRDIVPKPILERRDKIGFVTPERRWLGKLSAWVESTLDSDRLDRITPLDTTRVRSEWEQIKRGDRPFDARAWRWINLICWSRRFSVTYSA